MDLIAKEAAFEAFWRVYPKRVAKIAAQRAWKRIVNADTHLIEILEGLEKWKGNEQWQNLKYIPYPATFLNQRRWEDEVPANGKPELTKTQQRSKTNAEVLNRVCAAVDSSVGRALQSGTDGTTSPALPQGTRGPGEHGD